MCLCDPLRTICGAACGQAYGVGIIVAVGESDTCFGSFLHALDVSAYLLLGFLGVS